MRITDPSLDEATTATNLEWWSPTASPAHQRVSTASASSPSTTDLSLPAVEEVRPDTHPLANISFVYDVLPHLQRHQSLPRSMSVSAPSPKDPSSLQADATNFLPPPRQIRFVSTDGQPYTKRRRINAACLTCRKRKTRCSGDRPQCKTCTDTGHTCAGYPGKSKKRDEKADNDNEDDVESQPSSPRRSKHEQYDRPHPGENGLRPAKLTKQPSADPAASDKLGQRDNVADMRSPASNYTANSTTSSKNRVPYFRFFGPTAIVPGFKQMVVSVKDHRRSHASLSVESPAAGAPFDPASVTTVERYPVDIPFYDATDPSSNAPLITHLCELFFSHLGCNYPFLQRERFMRDLEEKKVDAILVDAVCAIAARYSSDPLLVSSTDESVPREGEKNEVRRPFRGHPFAHRAMSAVIDTFPCPTIAVAQACLLLAYEQFGTDRDSGLWMYLGAAIRMAQDLGIQKLDGLQLEGRIGPTPKTAKNGDQGRAEERRRAEHHEQLSASHVMSDQKELEDRRASEQERIDTFWAIFYLDRAVSSGVGRPVTLRDKDIDISFPYRPSETMINGYPHPFPPMIRIVHMYGRVADVLNNIRNVTQVTPEVLKKLASMEKDLTSIYQRLSPKLHFNATNFQHYVKAEQGTNFILLHFWFHTLIILMHQPTLLHSFEGRIQQLFPDSRELSMSSAKTIADILAFAELIDVKSFIGNPFTSQPMYVAACAFLAEAAAHTSRPPSRHPSPPTSSSAVLAYKLSGDVDHRAASSKHTLLASAANQNYQRCYKALKILDSYWAGCRYILTALDQKSKGLMDPLLYTSDDVDGPMPSTEPSFTTPGWRRSHPHVASMGASPFNKFGSQASMWSPSNWNQAIGWSLTGTTNSPQPNLSFLYPNAGPDGNGNVSPAIDDHAGEQNGTDVQREHKAANASSQTPYDQFAGQHQSASDASTMMPPPRGRVSSLPYDPVSTAEADLLMGLSSPYSADPGPPAGNVQQAPPSTAINMPHSYDFTQPHAQQHVPNQDDFRQPFMPNNQPHFSDMFIESQDVDMTGQGSNFAFPGGDMIPWLEYLPQDVLNYFGDANEDGSASLGHAGTGAGPGPPSGTLGDINRR